MEFLKLWVKDIAIVFVLISLVEMSLPDNNMKRYVDMILGILVMVVIITPFINLINKDFDLDTYIALKSINRMQEEESKKIGDLSVLHEEQIETLYLNKIEKEIELELLAFTDYEIDKIAVFAGEKIYGDIGSIEIVLKKNMDRQTKENGKITVARIQAIKIEGEEKEETEQEILDNSHEIIDTISKKYNVPKKKIKLLLNTAKGGK